MCREGIIKWLLCPNVIHFLVEDTFKGTNSCEKYTLPTSYTSKYVLDLALLLGS